MREVFDFGLTYNYNMVKRKAELRSGSIGMTAHKYSELKTLRSGAEQHWQIDNLQPFFPPIEKLFKTTLLENASEYGIRFEDEVTSILSPTSIRSITNSTIEVHRKTSMLLGPFKWMQGDYGKTLGLPSTTEESESMFSKLQNSNNSAYVGAIISSALAHSGCQHFPSVYGVFTGISKKHTIDISDDYPDLCERSWFSQNIGKTFEIQLSDEVQNASEFKHTRTARLSIQLGEEIDSLGNIQELDGILSESKELPELKQVFHDEEENDNDDESDSSSVSTSYIFGVKSCDCDSDEENDETNDDDGESEEPFAWASFTNVPVQITLLEKCEGTIYELCMKYPDTTKHLAWISQVMFALAFAQRNFAFVHNDLHANNVMFNKTDKEFLYYNCGGTLFQVPTYGYLIKIIDFERSSMSLKLNGMKEPKFFISDHFLIDEEAAGQYNCEPFYTPKQPSIKPNPSFDLVRLATSLFWDLFPEGPQSASYSENLLFKLFMKWLTLEDGTSVFFGKHSPKHDRYHGFYLYKAIARFCKDTAVPRKEILSLKSIYGIEKIPLGVSVCSIDF